MLVYLYYRLVLLTFISLKFYALANGQTLTADVTIARSPLYVKAGSIIPLCTSDVQYANIADWQSLDIKVYPGANGIFTLYEDEGDGFNYKSGKYSEITFTWNDKSRSLIVGKRRGSFTGMLSKRTFRIVLPNGSSKTILYNGSKVSVKL